MCKQCNYRRISNENDLYINIIRDLYIKITRDLYTTIIFIAISAIKKVTNMQNCPTVNSAFRSPSPCTLLQQILSTKIQRLCHHDNNVRIYTLDFVPFHVEPYFFIHCFFVRPCILPLCKNIKGLLCYISC